MFSSILVVSRKSRNVGRTPKNEVKEAVLSKTGVLEESLYEASLWRQQDHKCRKNNDFL